MSTINLSRIRIDQAVAVGNLRPSAPAGLPGRNVAREALR